MGNHRVGVSSHGHRLGAIVASAVVVLVTMSCTDDGSDVSGTIDGAPPTAEDLTPGESLDPTSPTDTVAEDLQLTPVAQGVSLTAMAADPSTGDLYVAERAGQVVRVDPAGTLSDPIIDISGEVTDGFESGLLGLAFSPDGDYVYLSYSDPDNATAIVEFPFGGGSVDGSGRRPVFAQEQPFENHNGGGIAFGPDGFLYIGLGDGGSGGDPLGSGQDTSTTLGSILRIDPLADCDTTSCVDGAYAIPEGNPFEDEGGAPEIWSYGVRNPWRFSFDLATGDLWVGDVGQNSVEEVTFLAGPDAGRGANLGWNLMEGDVSFDRGVEPIDHVGPIVVYENGDGNCSVTGGYVYRGEAIPALDGVYLYGDFCAGDVLGVRSSDGEVTARPVLGLSAGRDQLASFGQDLEGEVYVLTLGGMLFRLDSA